MKHAIQNIGGRGGGLSVTGWMMSFIVMSLALCSDGARGATVFVPGEYATIQGAIDAAQAGDTIEVSSGSYAGAVTITKSITLRGPNHEISPNTGARLPEAVITGVVAASTALSGQIVIEGFRFTGATPLLSHGAAGVHHDFVFCKNLIDGGSAQLAIFTSGPTSTATALIDDNRFLQMAGNAMQLAAVGSIEATITNNVIDGTVTAGINTDGLSNSIISGNLISNTGQQGVQIAGISSNVRISGNTFTNTNISAGADRGAVRIYGTNFSGPVSVTGNIINGGNTAFAVRNGENISGKSIEFSGNTMTGVNGSLVYHGGTGSLDASFNYWGSPDGPGASIVGDVDSGIYYTDGALSEVTAPVVNVTNVSYFSSLQSALAAASPGDVLSLSPGVHTGPELVISKAVTILGANSGLAGTDAARTAESQIFNMKISITVPGVIIDGVEIYQTNNTADAIVIGAAATVKNSVLRRFGVSTGTIARAITTAVGVTGYVIEDNLFTGDLSGSLFGGHKTWNSGIYLNGGSGTIAGNTFEICRAAINADDFNAGITITGNTFQTCGTYLSFGGTTPTDGDFAIAGNEFAFNFAIAPASNPTLFNNSKVEPTFRMDVTGNTFGGIASADLTLAQKFAIEVRTFHRGRSGRNGVVDFIEGEQIVMPGTSIQLAINAADDGDTVHVAPGTYAEYLYVDRPLTLLGPNAGISPNGGVRGAEAVIVPSSVSVTGGNLIEIESSDVTIDGFVLDGDNPALTSGFPGTNGADLDAACGIFQFMDGINTLAVRNNVIQNLSYFGALIYGGTGAAPATTGSVLSDNLIRNLGTYDAASGIANWGGGVLLYNNQYVRVVDNVMANVRIGVQTGNYSRANPGAADFQVIAGNEIEARRVGVFHNLHYSLASPFTFSDNVITGLAHPNETLVRAVLLGSLSVGSVMEGNEIVMGGVSVPSRGYEIWNVKASSPAVISGGSVSGAGTGLFLNNYEGYNSNAADGTHASVSSLAIAVPAGGTGIRVLDSPNSAHAAVSLTFGTGVSISGGATGIVVENANASVAALSNLSFTGQSGNYIELIANAGNINATTATFAGKNAAEMSTGELLAVENKMIHKPDSSALGFITILPAFDVTEIVIDDEQVAGDFNIPAGSRVIITATGSLTVNGALTLSAGATLEVLDGDLVLPDGSVMSGLFTFFNSFGSVDFDGDVTISGSAEGLILVSDVHVADGATITVNGTFTIDGCTVDSPGSFDLVVNAGADFTMARTAFSDGDIEVNSGSTEIYDNRFTDTDIIVTGTSNGARIFHNVFSPTTTFTNGGVGTVTEVDAWGNVTSLANTLNNLPLSLELDPALITGNRTIDADGVAYVQPGDAVSAAFSVSALQNKIVGVELLLGYNTELLSASSLGLGSNWDDVMPFTESDSTNVIGRYNAAIGLDFTFPDPSGTNTSQTVGDLGLVAGSDEGTTQVFHRVKVATDTVPGTRLAKGLPETGYLTPFTSNTPMIVIDETEPLTNTLLTGATILQSGQDMTQFITLQGMLEISASAFDALAGIDDVDAVVTLVGPATYTATQVSVTDPGPTIGADVYTTYGFQYAVTATTLNGDYDVIFTVTDRSGNTKVTDLGEITINKNQISATVELEGLVIGPVTRNVTFAFTDSGTVLSTRTLPVVFTNGTGTVTLTDVSGDTDQLSVKTATHLRERLPVVFTDGQASVSYTGAGELQGGDLNGDNIVNLLDYAVLKFYWLNVVGTVPAAAAAEINGDGSVNLTDYQILQSNFYQQGDPQ